MKILGIIITILLVTVVLFSWGSLLDDFEENYIETGISEAPTVNSSFKEDYDNRSTEIQEDFSPLIEDIDDLGSSEGWLDTIASGAVILPQLIVTLPKILLDTTTSAGSDMRLMLTNIGIPNELALIGVIILSLVILFKIIELIRRYKA